MVSLIVRNKNREPIKSKCQSLFGKLSRSSSHSNMSRMENDLKMVEENTSKFENQLNVSIDALEQYIKIGKCQEKISKKFTK